VMEAFFAGACRRVSCHSFRPLFDVPGLPMMPRQSEGCETSSLSRIRGERDFHFTLSVEGSSLDTATVVASAETVTGAPVPLRCRWSRLSGDLIMPCPDVTGDRYQISADDIGALVSVEARPADYSHAQGQAFGEIGPFELEAATRRSLDDALGRGEITFKVTPTGGLSDTPPAPLQVHVTSEGVRISDSDKATGGVFAAFTAEFPRVLVHPVQSTVTSFKLVISDTISFDLLASSRTHRDLIVLSIRCLHAQSFITPASILEAVLPVRQSAAAVLTFGRDSLAACLQLERHVSATNTAVKARASQAKALHASRSEVTELEAQLDDSINAYTEAVQGLEQRVDDGGGAQKSSPSPEQLQEEVAEFQTKMVALNEELSGRRQLLQEVQNDREADIEALAASVKLREERDMLQARLAEVLASTATAMQLDKSTKAHVYELKRLRREAEQLHSEKERLRRDLSNEDHARQELQQNLLYVKGQLEKWEARNSRDADGGGHRSVERYQQQLEKVTEERSILSMRLEQAMREAEEDKVRHDQQVERVVAANARLLEERDRGAMELQRVSQVYAALTQQLQTDAADPGDWAPDVADDAQALPGAQGSIGDLATSSGSEDLSALRERIASVDAALQQATSEIESLKRRTFCLVSQPNPA